MLAEYGQGYLIKLAKWKEHNDLWTTDGKKKSDHAAHPDSKNFKWVFVPMALAVGRTSLRAVLKFTMATKATKLNPVYCKTSRVFLGLELNEAIDGVYEDVQPL